MCLKAVLPELEDTFDIDQVALTHPVNDLRAHGNEDVRPRSYPTGSSPELGSRPGNVAAPLETVVSVGEHVAVEVTWWA